MDNLISIIVPIYNSENTIEKCVCSLQEQTYKNLEILLINDGSSDCSEAKCKMLAKNDERIVYFKKENGGLSDARNFGVKHARGKYVGFVDSDDWVDNTMYEVLYSAICKYKVDISVCGLFWVYGDVVASKRFSCKEFVCDCRNALKTLIDIRWGNFACNKLYKKSLFKNIEYPFKKYYEDIYTTYKLYMKAHKICFVTKNLYYYVQRKKSISYSLSLQNTQDEIEGLMLLREQLAEYVDVGVVDNAIIDALFRHRTAVYFCDNTKEKKRIVNYINDFLENNNFSACVKAHKIYLLKKFSWLYVPKFLLTQSCSPVYGKLKNLKSKIIN